jgi:hypothetical protein
MSDVEKKELTRKQGLEDEIEELEWQRLREFKKIQMKLLPLWIIALLAALVIVAVAPSGKLSGWMIVATTGIVAAVYLVTFSIAARNKAKIAAEISEKRAQLQLEFGEKQ